jgi:hypothetical protein
MEVRRCIGIRLKKNNNNQDLLENDGDRESDLPIIFCPDITDVDVKNLLKLTVPIQLDQKTICEHINFFDRTFMIMKKI